MQGQGIPGGAGQASQCVDAGWLAGAGQPFRLAIDVPLSADMAAAALYDDPITSFSPDRLRPADMASDQVVREAVAAAITDRGVWALRERADELARPGADMQPGWLAFCHQRAAEAIPGLDAARERREAKREADWEAGA